MNNTLFRSQKIKLQSFDGTELDGLINSFIQKGGQIKTSSTKLVLKGPVKQNRSDITCKLHNKKYRNYKHKSKE